MARRRGNRAAAAGRTGRLSTRVGAALNSREGPRAATTIKDRALGATSMAVRDGEYEHRRYEHLSIEGRPEKSGNLSALVARAASAGALCTVKAPVADCPRSGASPPSAGFAPSRRAIRQQEHGEDRRRSAKAGFDAHLVKPVALLDIERTLFAVASRRNAERDGPRSEPSA